MVEIPRYPRRLVTSDDPKSSLTRADLESPYKSLASALHSVGDNLNEIGKEAGEQAGYEAVTTGPDGTPQVSPAPMIGDTKKMFDRAVRVAGLAKFDSAADRDLLDLREKHRFDPDGFLKAANAYRDAKKAQSADVTRSPQVGVALEKAISNRTTSIYDGLLGSRQRTELARSGAAIDARMADTADDLEILARNGGVDTPDFRQRQESLKALLDEKVNNPLFHYPREQADRALEAVMTRAHKGAVLDQVEKVYGQHGFEAARNHLRSTVRDSGLTLRAGGQIEREGMAWLRSEEAGLKGERDAVTREWSAAKGQIATLPRDSLIALRERAAAAGNYRVALDADMHMGALDIAADVRGRPASERAFINASGTLPEGLSGKQQATKVNIENEARRQGVDPNVAVAIGWRESSLGTNTKAATSSAEGPFQLTRENRQRMGLSDTASDGEKVAAGVRFVKETTDTLRSQLGREPTPAEIYIGHFQGAGAATAIIRANPDAKLKDVLDTVKPGWGDTVINANPFLKQYETVGEFRAWADRAMGGAGSDLTQSRTGLLALGMMKKEMAKEIGTEIGGLRERIKKEEFPPLDDVMALGEKVHAIGTPEQKREVAELVAIAKVGQQFIRLPAAQRAQLISEADADLKEAAPRFDARLRDAMRNSHKAITAAYKADPYDAFHHYSRSEAAKKPTPAFDFGDPGQMAAVIDLRLKQQSVMRAEEGMGPVSVIRPPEAEALRGALSSGDAKQVGGIFSAFDALPNDVLSATLADPTVKAAVAGVARSTDPFKFNVGMAALDRLRARDPVEFARIFQPDTEHALANWQANLRYMDPKSLAAERQKAEDPQVAARRKVNETAGETKAREYSPDQIVAQFDQSWGVTPGFIARNVTGTQPLAPVDFQTRDALMGDWENTFKRRYSETLDKDVAAKQTTEMLRTKWARSEANEGRLMLRAPEQVYRAVDGSHDWMQPQIEEDIEKRLGVQRQKIGARRAWDYSLVTDRETETQSQRYDKHQPASAENHQPTYQVVIRDNRRATPQWTVLTAEDGRALRFGFDPDTPFDAADAKRRTMRDRNEAFLSRKDVEAARAARKAQAE